MHITHTRHRSVSHHVTSYQNCIIERKAACCEHHQIKRNVCAYRTPPTKWNNPLCHSRNLSSVRRVHKSRNGLIKFYLNIIFVETSKNTWHCGWKPLPFSVFKQSYEVELGTVEPCRGTHSTITFCQLTLN